MNQPCRRRLCAWSVVAVAAALPAGLTAQNTAPARPATAAKRWTPPRAADGRQPDLQGVWNFSSLTPVERPPELGTKATFTEAEAREYAARTVQRNNRDFNVPEGNVGDYNNFWYDRGTRTAGTQRTSLITDPPDGRLPPFTAETAKRMAAIAEARRGLTFDQPTPGGWLHDLGPRGVFVRCLTGFNSGPPMVPGAYNNYLQIFQTPDHVVILNEMIHNARIVPLDGRPHVGIRQWTGDSRGHWEGDTLVVETINFYDTTFDMQGFRGPTPDMRLVERFTRTAPDTLLYEFTVDDPKTWTRPWSAATSMSAASERVYEFACHEGNYGVINILSGARAAEAAEAAGKTKPE